MKFIVYCFNTAQPKCKDDLLTVWVILYKDLDAVAFVTNNKNIALKVQTVYAKIGLTYDDDIDYWKQPIGLSPAAKNRLDMIHSAQARELFDEEYNKLLKKMNFSGLNAESTEDGTDMSAIDFDEKITIFDCVVPFCLDKFDENENNTVEFDETDTVSETECNSPDIYLPITN